MKIYYGAFRPLEEAFLHYLSDKKPGPDRPVLVVCPSGRVAQYLREQLAVRNGLISNVFFVTFSQLLASLDREIAEQHLPLLPGDGLHDYILKNLLKQPGLDLYRISRGFVAAVRTSLRDLSDAQADAEIMQEHLQGLTDTRLEEEIPHLQWLIDVFKAYENKMEQVPGFRSYKTYFADALAQAEKSSWLSCFSEIIVYGFYELTGRQLEIFQALRAYEPVSVFWLYSQEPAFAYGRKFFETNILGLATESQFLPQQWDKAAGGDALRYLFTDQAAQQQPSGLRFISAPNPERELFFVLKEMLRLHEEEGIAYADMAFTARSLEPYKTLLPEMCAQNNIALQADFSLRLTERPLGVFLINLLSLARGGFAREDVLAVVTSPYFKKKNAWRYLIEECLAQRDFAQWQNLVREKLHWYDPDFLPWLHRTKEQLEQLEQPAPWDDLIAKTLSFLQENTELENLMPEEQTILERAMELLQGFSRYQVIAKQACAREFLDELLADLQESQVHQVIQMPGGITAADVLNLRGLHFKVVFLLGLNEKAFPQLIREDPVLKDYYRFTLRDQLGFWINQKMERFNEERMLFFGTAQAADEKLYCSFLRSDAEGKPLIPSSYVVELARAAGIDLDNGPVTILKTRLAEQLKELNFNYLTPKEVSMLLAGANATDDLYQQAGLLDSLSQTSLQAARQISSHGALNPYDGMVSVGMEIFKQQNEKGFAPSYLQDLARCPMKYFLAKGVGLREKEDILSRSELAANLRGEAYHKILMTYYQKLYADGLTGQLFDTALQERLQAAVADNYTEKSYRDFGIYPVIWQLILQDIQEKLKAFVVEDAKNLGNYIPSLFETSFEGFYQPDPQLKIKLRGIIDRIDIDAEHKTFRVLDYKSSRYGGKDLTADMFKQVILQPFIYLILAQQLPQMKGLKQDGAALLNINKGYARQELSALAFESVSARAADFFTFLVHLIEQGRFFIHPSKRCEYCAYAAICRKNSFHSLIRARQDKHTQQLEEMQA